MEVVRQNDKQNSKIFTYIFRNGFENIGCW